MKLKGSKLILLKNYFMKDLLLRIINIWRPAIYQGNERKKNYFEGWYYKIVDQQKQRVLAIIPGIFQGDAINTSHAFIQMIQGHNHKVSYFEYPMDEFQSEKSRYKIMIVNNEFSSEKLVLNLRNNEDDIQGVLNFHHLKPWPSSLFSPGAMGPYRFFPMMQCNHAVISMDHTIEGSLKINGQKIKFDGGRGYTEKDWGKAFPSAYVWLQCNHFINSQASLFASVARVPWISGAFRGFIIGFLFRDELYRFSTYSGAHLEFLKINKRSVEFQVNNRTYKLNVTANRNDTAMLHAPYNKQFRLRVSECLNSVIEVKFWQTIDHKEKILFHDKGEPAALDVNGKLEEIDY